MANKKKPVEEAVFDLGSVYAFIMAQIQFVKPCREAYKRFNEDASLLKIDVQDLQNDNGWDDGTVKMITEQLRHVQSLIIEKSVYHRCLYMAGMNFERAHINILEDSEIDVEQAERLVVVKECFEEIKMIAETVGVEITSIESDLSRLTENLETHNKSFLWNAVKLSLKKALCQLKVVKYSEVEPSRIITTEFWVVSIVRLPDKNPFHAFLVVEGRDAQKSMIWFADLVVEMLSDLIIPETRDGKVRLRYYESAQLENCELLFKCKSKFMNVSCSDRLLYSSWSISATRAEKLIENLKEHKKNPPKFNFLGNVDVLAYSSAKSSSNEPGHNCYTFCRTTLNDLEDKRIQLPKQRLEDWAFTAASRYLPDYEKKTSIAFTSSLILALGVGGVVGFVLGKMI